MKVDFYHDKVVVITGGSSGIGLAVAKEFAMQNANVAIVSRDEAKLSLAADAIKAAGTGKGSVDTFAADVSDAQQIANVITAIGAKFGRIDVLINCAGIATCGHFKDQSPQQLNQAMQVNYMGAVFTTHAAWPFLKAAKGQLSFVSSVAGYIGLIGYAGYAPTKFAMTGLAECLRYEGKDDGIALSVIYPGDTDTPLLQYEKQHTLEECKALSKNIKVKTAEEVARIYIKGLQQNKFEIYCDFESRVIRWFKSNFPSAAYYVSNAIIKKARKK